MLMIPLPFVIAIFAISFALSELHQRGLERRNGWLLAFLGVLIFQEVLVGLRFGYTVEWLRLIQPLSAALMAPLAYLSFKRPQFDRHALIHLWPLGAVLLAIGLWIDGLDTALALSNLVYAYLLIRLGMGGTDALEWVEVRRADGVMLLLWAVTAVLLVSCLTDAAIAYDFWITQGSNTSRIAGWTSGLALLGFGVGLAVLAWQARRRKSGQGVPVAEDADDHAEVFSALEALMAREQLHLDPDINLNRIARRMVRPARDVSRAVNSNAGCNVSQYINRLRVTEACRLLADTDMAVTQVIYAAGFNTKSNFNREFTRNTGQTPSAWREVSTRQ